MKIVLAGAGHTHALCLLEWWQNHRQVFSEHEIIVVSPNPESYYSGMWTGLLHGSCDLKDLAIPAKELCEQLGCKFILGEVSSVSPNGQSLGLIDGRSIEYEILSINVGGIANANTHSPHVFSVKPLAPWYEYLKSHSPKSVAIQGGGVAGCEVALGLRSMLGPGVSISIYEKQNRVVPAAPLGASKKITKALREQNIELFTQQSQVKDAEFVLISTGLKAPKWVRESGLEMAGSYLAIDDQLRTSHSKIFAVGDVAQHRLNPWARSGVYSVRQAPILARNITALAKGQALENFHAQNNFLALMTISPRKAMGFWGPFYLGPYDWLYTWKDKIDRKFMKMFDLAHLSQ